MMPLPKTFSETRAYICGGIGGCVLWVGTSLVSGRTEAWDSSLYWTVSYPLALVLAGILAYLVPDRPWRWSLAVMLVQPLILAVTASSFGLLPLGLLMFAVLAVPAVMVASIAAGIRRRREG